MKRRARLTQKEKEAVCSVLHEFLAGHDGEMVRAIGLADTVKQGDKLLDRVGSAVGKLTTPDRETTRVGR